MRSVIARHCNSRFIRCGKCLRTKLHFFASDMRHDSALVMAGRTQLSAPRQVLSHSTPRQCLKRDTWPTHEAKLAREALRFCSTLKLIGLSFDICKNPKVYSATRRQHRKACSLAIGQSTSIYAFLELKMELAPFAAPPISLRWRVDQPKPRRRKRTPHAEH